MLLLGAVLAHDEIPELPFPNVQDPLLCGMPQQLGNGVPGTLDGRFQGELVEPEVHLYDSHLRSEVTGHLPHGAEVLVTMYQDNPVLDFYFVVGDSDEGPVRGWVPKPFITLAGE
jgi:hypothetical protein